MKNQYFNLQNNAQYCKNLCKLCNFLLVLKKKSCVILQVKIILFISCADFAILRKVLQVTRFFFQNLQQIVQSTELTQVYAILRLILQLNFFSSYLAKDFAILRKILQVLRFYFFKTYNKLRKVHNLR